LKVRGIIFDVDGTLGDTVPLCYEAFRRALLELTGKRWDDPEIDSLFGPTEEGIFQRLMPDRWEHGMDLYIDAYKDLHPRLVKPFAGLDDILTFLQGHGVHMSVVTGKGARSASVTLGQLGLKHYFEQVEPGSPKGSIKAETILKLTQGWDLEPEEVAYLGDSPGDIRDTKKAGAVALAAAWASNTTTERLARIQAEGPDEIFHAIEDFRRWVERNVDHVSQNLT
jgi:phosphoglycolate phosphatase-like HAD superfamily hydrolase